MTEKIDRDKILGYFLQRIAQMNPHYKAMGLEPINPVEFLKDADELSDELLVNKFNAYQAIFAETERHMNK